MSEFYLTDLKTVKGDIKVPEGGSFSFRHNCAQKGQLSCKGPDYCGSCELAKSDQTAVFDIGVRHYLLDRSMQPFDFEGKRLEKPIIMGGLRTQIFRDNNGFVFSHRNGKVTLEINN